MKKMHSTKKHQKAIDVDVKLPEDAVFRVFGSLLSDLDILPLNRKLRGALRARDGERLLEAASKYDPQCIVGLLGCNKSLGGALSFAKLYQVGALIKKFPFKLASINKEKRKAAALEKFEWGEQVCKLFNAENIRALQTLNEKHPKFYGVIEELREEIISVIGAEPDIEKVLANGQHGPGQTTAGQFRNGRVTKFYKYATVPYTVSRLALPHAKAAIEADPRWVGALQDWYRVQNNIPIILPIDMNAFWDFTLRIVDHSTIATVPKTALVDRTIEMGPTLNIFLQLGVDYVIRRLLRQRWGYYLNTQEKNQILALEGSIGNELATLDLKGASDTVSLAICELLLPPLWYDFLFDLRTGLSLLMDGESIKKTYRLEKMSAMGNGFTFVLETLIFGAATRVAMRRTNNWGKSAVYGDDIVLPSKAAPYLIELLELMGFYINEEKSFIDGPFRESCGTDYYLGHNVRPLFITDKFDTVPRLFHLLNSFLKIERDWDHVGLEFPLTTKLLRTWIPPDFLERYHGPYSEDTDTHVFDESKPLPRDKDGYRYFRRLVERAHVHKGRYKTYFFQKLMVDLRQVPVSQQVRPQKWDWQKRLDTGNAFDITRRGATKFCCVRSKLPDYYG